MKVRNRERSGGGGLNVGVIHSGLRDVLGGVVGLGIYRIRVDGCWKCRRLQVAGIVDGGWLGMVWLRNLRFCSTGLNSAVTGANRYYWAYRVKYSTQQR